MDTGSMPEQSARSQVPTAAVAVIYFKGSDYIPGTTVATPPRSNFAQVLNINLKQVVFRTTESPENGSVFYAKIFSPAGTRWKLFKLSSRTVKAEANSSEDFQVGADIEPVDATGPFDDPDKWYGLKGPRAADYQFLSTTSLVQSLPPDAVCPILNSWRSIHSPG